MQGIWNDGLIIPFSFSHLYSILIDFELFVVSARVVMSLPYCTMVSVNVCMLLLKQREANL